MDAQTYAVSQRWFEGADLSRLDVIVPENQRTLRDCPEYEVLCFYTEAEWDRFRHTEGSGRKWVWATFRAWDDAEQYAQSLLLPGKVHLHRVLLWATKPPQEEQERCVFCRAVFPADFDQAVNDGWMPSYYEGEDECAGPVCPQCVKTKLNDELELLP
jgi:hypothetical protein